MRVRLYVVGCCFFYLLSFFFIAVGLGKIDSYGRVFLTFSLHRQPSSKENVGLWRRGLVFFFVTAWEGQSDEG